MKKRISLILATALLLSCVSLTPARAATKLNTIASITLDIPSYSYGEPIFTRVAFTNIADKCLKVSGSSYILFLQTDGTLCFEKDMEIINVKSVDGKNQAEVVGSIKAGRVLTYAELRAEIDSAANGSTSANIRAFTIALSSVFDSYYDGYENANIDVEIVEVASLAVAGSESSSTPAETKTPESSNTPAPNAVTPPGKAYNEQPNGTGIVYQDSKESIYQREIKFDGLLDFDNCGVFSEGLAKVRYEESGKYGFIDKTGKLLIPALYQNAYDFNDGLAWVSKDGIAYGCIDTSGKVVIPFEYESGWMFMQGTALAVKNDKVGFIDKNNKVIIPFEYDNNGGIAFSKDGWAAVSLNGKWGTIDKNNKPVIPFKYDSLSGYSGGEDGEKYYICVGISDGTDAEGNPKYKWGYIDQAGKAITEFEYDECKYFGDGLAAVKKDGKWGFIDTSGKVVISFKYAYVASGFSEGLAFVAGGIVDDGEFYYFEDVAYIDTTGKEVLSFKIAATWGTNGYYDTINYAGAFTDGYAWAAEIGYVPTLRFIDHLGRQATPMYVDVQQFNENLALTYSIDYGSDSQYHPSYYILEISKPFPATPTNAKVIVNGKEVAFDAYNIDNANYFKLRDFAYILSGTEKQFDVEWDAKANKIDLKLGYSYTPVGGEMAEKGISAQIPVTTGTQVGARNETGKNYFGESPDENHRYSYNTNLRLTSFNINGNNYFKLRDLAIALDFGLTWDAASSTISIDTTVGYTDN